MPSSAAPKRLAPAQLLCALVLLFQLPRREFIEPLPARLLVGVAGGFRAMRMANAEACASGSRFHFRLSAKSMTADFAFSAATARKAVS